MFYEYAFNRKIRLNKIKEQFYREDLISNNEILLFHGAKTKIEGNKGIDYIIAPIADNRMFEIIDSFIEGEITDIQCQHCLSATDLGRQYVFVSRQALNNITLLERCYISEPEKEMYLASKQESFSMNMDKVKLARKQYRNQGDYIEDILK